jgi:chitinase
MPDPALVTHINYAFGSVNATFNGVDIGNPDRLRTIVALKQQAPALKVQLSIGGWTSGRFSEMAADSITRRAFAQDCKRIVAQYDLDGIDMDWEYPTSSEAGISSSPDDTRNFTLLMHDLRSALGDDKLLTLASVASARYVDFRAILDVIDFVNIMSYDVGRPPCHQSGLYRSEHTGRISTAEAVQAHIDSGVPAARLTMGVPFYGHGIGAIPDFIDYKDIIHLTGYTRRWDDIAKVPYLVDSAGNFVCNYEDAQSIAAKCEYVIDNNLLGLMYWEYSCDDADGTLRRAVHRVVE